MVTKKKSKSSSLNSVASYNEADWRAQEDCRVLIEAEKIKRDPARLKAAKKEAAKRAKEMMVMADAAKDLANGTKESKAEDKGEPADAD